MTRIKEGDHTAVFYKATDNSVGMIIELKITDYDMDEKKITHLSEVIYMIVDRISTGENIRKNFEVNDPIYFDHINGCFTQNHFFTIGLKRYDLKFAIYHKSCGHFIAYSKIRNEWYLFDDCSNDYASKEKPPLDNVTDENVCSVCFYYVLSEWNKKILLIECKIKK